MTCPRISRIIRSAVRTTLTAFIPFLVLTTGALAQGPGVAAGFGIDGNLLSRSPSGVPYGTTNDWVPGANSASTAVLTNGGLPVDSTKTRHSVDGYGGADLSIFGAASQKVSDNPNTYTWKEGSVPPKDDINNALFSWLVDGSGNIWVMVGGDRMSVGGTSYIDFEFLQNSLIKNPDSTFTSLGPNGGRTIGDILITIDLSNGGSQATFKVQRWEVDGGAPSGFKYHNYTPPSGAAYTAANIDSAVWVPFGAFGSTTYAKNAFGEAALNMTKLLKDLNPCIAVPVVFIRTKSSDSPTAELKDFIDPINVNLNLGAEADAGPDKVLTCDVTQVNLEGSSTTPNCTYSWTATGGGHIVSGASTLTPLVDAPGTYILTVTRSFGSSSSSKTSGFNGSNLTASVDGVSCICTAVDTAIVTRDITLPNANAGADKVITCSETSVTLSGSSTTPSVTFSWLATEGGHIVSGGLTATPLVDAAGKYILTVTNPANGCTAMDSALVTVDQRKPALICSGDELTCDSLLATAAVTSNPAEGVSYLWTPAPISGQGTRFARYDTPGSKKVVVTILANGCMDSCEAVITQNIRKPVLTCTGDTLLCNKKVATASVSSSVIDGVTYWWTPEPVGGQGTSQAQYALPGAKKVVVTITATGCKDSCEATIGEDVAKPDANAGPDRELTCAVTELVLNGSSSTQSVSFSWEAALGGNIVSGGNTATPLINAPGTYVLTVTSLINGCQSVDTAIVTQDITKPNVDAGSDKVLTCANTRDTLSGSSSTPGVSFSWVASAGGHIVSGANTPTPIVDAAGLYILTVTNSDNGCWAADTASVTMDHEKPRISCSGDELTCDSLLATASVTTEEAGVTYVWIPEPVSGQGTRWARYDAPGIKTVVATLLKTGCKDTCQAEITQNVVKPIVSCVGDTITCAHSLATATLNFAATAGATIHWDPAPVSGQATTSAQYDQPGFKKVVVTFDATGCKDSCEAWIGQDLTKPQLSCTGDELTCDSTEATASVTIVGAQSKVPPPYIFVWSPEPLSGQGTPYARYNTPGTKWVVVTYTPTGCKDSCSSEITQNIIKPSISCSGDELTCDSLLATASVAFNPSKIPNGETYLWTPEPISGQGTQWARYDAPGPKKVVVTYTTTGCKDSCEATITQNIRRPEISCGADTITCAHPQATAWVNSGPSVGVSYTWDPTPISGQGTTQAVYDTPGPKKVIVTILATGCKDSCTVDVQQDIYKPALSCSGDQLTCDSLEATASVQLVPTGSKIPFPFTFHWTPEPLSGQGTQDARYNTPGTKWVVVTYTPSGCKDSCSAEITQDVVKPILSCGGDTLTCDSLLATASVSLPPAQKTMGPVWSYLWSPAPISGQGTPFARYDTPGTKWVVVTYTPTGCKDSCSSLIEQNITKPSISCSGDELTCDSLLATASVSFDPSKTLNGVTYLWTPEPISGQGTQWARYDTPGSKKVVVTYTATGCKDSCEANITQNTRRPEISCGADTITCAHPQATAWVNSGPSVGVSYTWDPTPISGQGTTQAVYDTPGPKKVIVTILATGCKDSCTVDVQQDIYKPVLSCSGDQLTCDSLEATASVQLLPTGSKIPFPFTFHWTPEPLSGQGTQDARYNTPGTKWVVVTYTPSGCKDSCSAEITQDVVKPILTCNGDELTCDSLLASATVTMPTAQKAMGPVWSYLWSPAPISGQGTPFARYDTPGTKWVVVTYTPTGCKDSCSSLIEQNITKPSISCSGDELTCDSLLATASVSFEVGKTLNGVTYLWTPEPISGQGTQWARYDTPGSKKVVVTYTATGCKDSCEATITQNIHRPEISCGADTITCAHPQATAWVNSGPSVGVSYFWDPTPLSGQGSTQAVYDTPGPKKVIVTILATGCKDSCTVDVQQDIYKPVLSCSGDQLTCDSLAATASVQLLPTGSKIPFPFTFHWTPEPISGQGTQDARYNTPGTKWVVVTYTPSGCKDSCSAEITQDVVKPILTCNGDELTCDSLLASATVTLPSAQKAMGSVWSYLWSPAPISGQGTPEARYDTPGTKWVVVTYMPTGCKDSCSSEITQNIIKPSISCSGDELTCDSLLATASVAFNPTKTLNGVTYLWTPEPISGQGTQWARYDTPGSKKVVVTYTATGCKDSCEATITQNIRRPEVSCGADTITCAHPQATAWVNSGPSVGVSYFWDPTPLSGQGSTQAVYDTPGIKVVVVTILATGCKDSCIVDVIENTYKPTFTCFGDELTCDSLLATASVIFPTTGSQAVQQFTYLWTPAPISGQGTMNARYDTPGQKKVVVTYLPTGCKDSCEATITQSVDKPLLSCSGDELTCDSLLASATVTFPEQWKEPNPSPYSYLWSPAPISGQGTPSARYDSPGTKWVVVTVLATGCKDSCSATITQNIEKPSLRCSGDELTCDSLLATASVTLSAPGLKMNGSYSIVWNPTPVSGQGTSWARYNSPGTKWAVVTNLANGCTDSCSAEITQNTITPELSCSGDVLTCDSLLATASVSLPVGKAFNGLSYFWSPAPVSGQGTPWARYDSPGQKRVVVTILATGCKDSCEATITQDIFKPGLQCFGDTLTCDSLQGTACVQWFDAGKTSAPIVSYLWRPAPVSGQGTSCARYDTPGQKWVVVTFLPNGCKDSCAATIVQSNSVPNANAGADKALTCTVTQVNLSGSSSTPGVSFNWVASAGGHIVSGGTTATPTVDAAGTYTLTVTNPTNGCKATDVALVTLNNTAPNANAGADKILTCTATQLNLSGSSSTPGATFSWVASAGGHIVSGANTATPLIDQPGTYTLTVTNPANGCTATDVASVTRNNTTPNADAGADKVLTCSVTQINLSGSSSTPGVTFSWVASAGGHIVSGANTATPLVDQPGTYTLTVTNPTNGCTATDVALVTRNATTPNVSAGVDKVLNCSVTSINLSGSSTTQGVTFNWVASGGGHIVSGGTTATPLVDQPGTYTLTVTVTATGCAASDAAVVTLDNTLPNADAGPDKALTCTITQIALAGASSTPGALFSWAATDGGHIVSGPTTATPIVDAAGTYTLTVTNPANGCMATDVALVTKTPNNPPVCVVPHDTSITTTTVPVTICLPVSATDADGDAVTCTKTSGAGTLSGGQWCFTWSAPKDTSVLVEIRCRDACDSCTSQFRVTILYRSLIPPCEGNIAPTCNLPHDTTIMQCIPTIVSLPVSATDANGNFKSCTIVSGPGRISSRGNWNYTPYGPDTVTVTIRCTDSCGAFCEGTFTVSFVPDNLKPVCKPVLDTTVHACPSVPIMIPLYANAIGLVDCYVAGGPGTLIDGYWVYTPTVNQDVRATVQCQSVCGKTWKWSLTVRVRMDGTNCDGGSLSALSGSVPMTAMALDPCRCPKPGDIDEDGQVSVSDLAILCTVVFEAEKLNDTGACPAIQRCDVNCDGVVDRKDVDAVTTYIFSQGKSLCDPCPKR